jgi:putative endonuclease
MEKTSYVYMLASGRYGTLYVGVTADLIRRVAQHREKRISGFTRQYNVTQLVWYEAHGEIAAAIEREKRIKHWNREWKLRLIHEMNPLWKDLYEQLVQAC